jgi:hypothetical protein
MNMSDEIVEQEPIRAALDALTWLTPELAAKPAKPSAQQKHDMRTLRLAVAATGELLGRGEPSPSPARVRAMMSEFAIEFVSDPQDLLEHAEAASAAGDEDRARALRLAYEWMANLLIRGESF